MSSNSSGVRRAALQPPLTPKPARAQAFDRLTCVLIGCALALLYFPTYLDLARNLWATDEQGHGPIILVVSLWLLFSRRHDLNAAPADPSGAVGWPLLVLSLFVYALGRSQAISMLEVGSQISTLAALVLVFVGWRGLRLIWFPLFFMLFMVPLPEALVATVTAPLKSAVSAVASGLLHDMGYPVGRSGVTMTVGPYQLLVADACAGLNSMFTLEALGMLYMNLMKYTSAARNVTLAVMLIPTAFIANIVRVVILVLVTYHFGDEAGQGFVHGFAGMVLFLVALGLMMSLDRVLDFFIPAHKRPA